MPPSDSNNREVEQFVRELSVASRSFDEAVKRKRVFSVEDEAWTLEYGKALREMRAKVSDLRTASANNVQLRNKINDLETGLKLVAR